MKFVCKRIELCEAVGNVQKAVSIKSSLQVLEGILIKAKDNEIIMTGYDLELGITTKIAASVEISGSIILNAHLLNDIVRRLPEEIVTIEVDEKLIATINCGEAEFTIIGIDASE